MRASGTGRGLNLRHKRAATVLIGLLAATVVIVALPTAAGGADRHVFRDVHHTKAFWRTATLKRATPAQLRPAFKFRTAHMRSFALNGSSLRKVLAKAPQFGTRSARTHPVIVSLPAPNGQLPAVRADEVADHGSGARAQASRHRDVLRTRDRRSVSIDRRRPEPHRLPRLGSLRARRLVHRSVLPQQHEPLRQLHRLGPRPLVRVRRARRDQVGREGRQDRRPGVARVLG